MAKPKAIICDIDGTLALLGDRDPRDASTALEDALNHPVANVLEIYDHQDKFDVRLILMTGRQEKYRTVTESWLEKHGISHYERLYMRDTDDRTPDFLVKRKIYEQEIKPHYDVIFVLEDRDQVVKMWRDIGLDCFQVAYGDF